MSLLNRGPREVYRVFEEDELAEQSSWLGAQATEGAPLEDGVPESPPMPPGRIATPAADRRSLAAIGTLLAGALAGLILGLVVVHGGTALSGGSGSRYAPGGTSSISAPPADPSSSAAGSGSGPPTGRPVTETHPRARPIAAPRRADSNGPGLPHRDPARAQPAAGSPLVASAQSRPIEAGPRDADAEFDFER